MRSGSSPESAHQAAAGKLWRMDYRFEGKRKTLSFGAYPAVGLKDARARREEAKGQIAAGIDPGAHKKAAKEAARADTDSTLRSLRENGSTVKRMVGLKATRGRLWRGLREIFSQYWEVGLSGT